jgi:hypothetical protein
MQIAKKQESEGDTGFTPYFLEKISELPIDNYGNKSQGQTQLEEDGHALHRQRAAELNLNFEGSVSFPSKLYNFLVDAETKGFSDVISWQPDGTSFKVHNQERFINDILPVYFGAIKFKSWQRQLNLYGFTRVHKGLTRGSYTHDHFVRGSKSVSLEISRQTWTSNNNNTGSSVVMPVDTRKETVRFSLCLILFTIVSYNLSSFMICNISRRMWLISSRETRPLLMCMAH